MQTFIAFLAGAAFGVAAAASWRWRAEARALVAGSPRRTRELQLHEEADRALKQSEENFRQFFDAIEDFLFVLDNDGHILKVNRAVTARLGYDQHELLGRHIHSLRPEAAQTQATSVSSDGRAGKAGSRTGAFRSKDGRSIPIELREVRGTWNGQPVAFCSGEDVACTKSSEEKFAKAFHRSPALTALIRSDDLTVFDVNQALLDVLGFTREEAIGKRPTELNLFVDLHQRDGLVEAMLRGQQPREVEIQLRSRSGAIRDGLVSTEILSLPHESLIMAVMVDVTERKRVEAALRHAAAQLERKNHELAVARDAALDASRVKSQFLANMSHEIRTPLNGMLGLTELLSRSPLSSDQQEYVDSISRCGDLLLTILNDLLDFSKIEAGRLQLESIPFDLPGLIFDVVDFYGTKASPADVELVVDLDPALPAGLLGDPGRLRQVLGNLVSNAVKFTSKGHILIKAKQERRELGKVAFSIAVSDTGEGIPEEAQGRLFQPFTQADASTSRRHGGTGLGLALCKRIVEGMGGRIDLHSRQGQGTTLTVIVELPIDETQAPPSTLSPLAGTRCLLVDDNALVRHAMDKQLRGLGVDVCIADSGESAITAAGAALRDGRPYDLVLVDLHMPGLGGERLAKVLRSEARLGSMGVVMLAPLVLHPDVSEGPSAVIGTCDGYLVKPARSELVAKILTVVLQNKRAGHTGVVVTRHSVLPPKNHAVDGAMLPFPLRVLIAEDNDVNQLVARRILEDVGASVTVVSDGQQALAAVQHGVFDLVIMDCQMPALDGFATTARIREHERTKGDHLPILAVTANSLAGDEEHCLSAGMDGYLGKPFSRQELLLEVLRLTRSKAANLGAEATVPASKPNLDRVRFKDMAQLLGSASSDGHAMLLRSFQRNTEKRVEELDRAIAGLDPEAAYGVAHAIKGSSGNLGFVGLEQLAGQIERMARAGQLQGLSVEMLAMQEELGRVRVFLEDYCKQTAVQG